MPTRLIAPTPIVIAIVSGILMPPQVSHVAIFVMLAIFLLTAICFSARILLQNIYQPEYYMYDKNINPFDSIRSTMTGHSRDWGANHRDAWLYGIVVGWDDENGNYNPDVLSELKESFGWEDADIARMQENRNAFVTAEHMMMYVREFGL